MKYFMHLQYRYVPFSFCLELYFYFQFVRSRVGGIRTGPEKCAISIDRSQDDTTLIFESRFESGNLAKAIQV